ncbi:hypothetical protein MMC28_002537 [Mycoblastus sanguinarius]|nr:hypothetical protein [Mycoblastus sanguinarius]
MAGYPQLSSVMATHPEIAIFRTFGSLNTRNLLYLQAELVHLEKELSDIEREDSFSNDASRQSFQYDWFCLQKSFEDGGDPFQWEKVLEIRKKLSEYIQVAAISSPTPHNVTLLREWLERPKYGKGFLRGVEAKAWDLEKGTQDFITLSNQQVERDGLSRFIYWLVPGIYHRLWGMHWSTPTVEGGIFEYPDSSLDRAARTLNTLLSSLLPTLSIFVLYYVKSPPARLGLILGFTIVFAITLQCVSRARPADIFAATAAFAAVQVVFVGSTSGLSA